MTAQQEDEEHVECCCELRQKVSSFNGAQVGLGFQCTPNQNSTRFIFMITIYTSNMIVELKLCYFM